MTKSSTLALDLRSTSMLLILAAIWGGSFFFGEVALSEVPPLTITLHRVIWALPILALIVLLKGIYIPRSPKVWGAYLVMGALNNAIPFSLIFWGQTQIESGLASILNGTTAMFGAVVAGLLLHDEPLTAKKIGGAGLGIAGVAVIMGPRALTDFNPSNIAQLAILVATLSYAFAGVWGKTMLAGQPPLMNAFGMLIGSTLLMIPICIHVRRATEPSAFCWCLGCFDRFGCFVHGIGLCALLCNLSTCWICESVAGYFAYSTICNWTRVLVPWRANWT